MCVCDESLVSRRCAGDRSQTRNVPSFSKAAKRFASDFTDNLAVRPTSTSSVESSSPKSSCPVRSVSQHPFPPRLLDADKSEELEDGPAATATLIDQ